MNWADWAIIAVLGFSVLISAVRGFIKEALSLVIWLAAAIIASIFHDELALWLVDLISTPSLRMLTAWITLFIVVLIIGGICSYLLGKLVEATGLTGTDRLLGVLFGLTRGLIIIMVVLLVLTEILPVTEDLWWQESRLISFFMQFENFAREAGAAVLGFLKNLL
ncbi:CvpA family protein [uncultured Porticoccus sp.]|uniref:CvpA family protein n=1 Tax=uncultured Porticoccus sp. TaxID=1256050 RepID=UPI0026396FB3|nr:CvpA family protein [uncultured Porticoccus sp.]